MQVRRRASARAARIINFFGTGLIVCQITGKNGVDFKNYIKNRFCGCAGVPARARRAISISYGTKDWLVKFLANLNVHISVNFSNIFINFVSVKMLIFLAFKRGTACYCSFIMWGTSTMFTKLVRNRNISISSKCVNLQNVKLNKHCSIFAIYSPLMMLNT